MNSVVTQEQLAMILASKNGLSMAQVEKTLAKNLSLRADEISSLYHNLLEVITSSTSEKEAALLIIDGIRSLLDRKLEETLENFNSGSDSFDGEESTKQLSPIFNRAG